MRREFIDDDAGGAKKFAIVVGDKTERQLVLVEAGGKASNAALK